jgi:pyrroline-5-carboxylate reductase
LSNPSIAFIGAGNMASSIIGGLLDQGAPVSSLRASDPFPASLEKLQELGELQTSTNNHDVIAGAEVLVLAVKPQVMGEVLADIRPALAQPLPLVISIAAGITISSLQAGLGEHTPIIRCMPNTPALLRKGTSALYANDNVSAEQRARGEAILAAVGSVHTVEREELLDAVTALSGSGPAYFFLLMEAMAEAGVKLGLDAQTSSQLANETALGAAMMVNQGDVDVTELRRRVSSPGGTTLAALTVFEQQGLRELVESAMRAAADRAAEMATELG